MVIVTVGEDQVRARSRDHLWVSRRQADGAMGFEIGPAHAPDASSQDTDASSRDRGGLRLVHGDLPRLTRAATRLLAADPNAAQHFAHEMARLARVTPIGVEGPVRTIVRATLPVLAHQPPFPVPLLPTAMAEQVHAGLRRPDLRSGAQVLFGDRATRPVVAALAELCCRRPMGAAHPVHAHDPHRLDMFAVTLAHAMAPLLEPDHLAALLRTVPGPFPPDPLDCHQARNLREVLAAVPARRITALCVQALTDGAARNRARHVADAVSEPAGRRTRSWTELASAHLLDGRAPAPAATDVHREPPVRPGRPATAGRTRAQRQEARRPEAQPRETQRRETQPPPALPPVDTHGLTMHRVSSQQRLNELARVLRNCLDTYGGRLEGVNRIIEFRRDGAPVYAAHLRRRRIVTLEAAGNGRPPGEDLPVIRRLLLAGGHLDDPAVGDQALDIAATPARTPAIVDRRVVRRDQLDRTPVSLQALATSTAAGDDPDETTDWCELAAALWLVGSLEHFPEPTRPAARQVVLDVATELAAGAQPRQRHRRTADDRRTKHDELRRRAAAHEPGWWSCLVMADILARPLVP